MNLQAVEVASSTAAQTGAARDGDTKTRKYEPFFRRTPCNFILRHNLQHPQWNDHSSNSSSWCWLLALNENSPLCHENRSVAAVKSKIEKKNFVGKSKGGRWHWWLNPDGSPVIVKHTTSAKRRTKHKSVMAATKGFEKNRVRRSWNWLLAPDGTFLNADATTRGARKRRTKSFDVGASQRQIPHRASRKASILDYVGSTDEDNGDDDDDDNYNDIDDDDEEYVLESEIDNGSSNVSTRSENDDGSNVVEFKISDNEDHDSKTLPNDPLLLVLGMYQSQFPKKKRAKVVIPQLHAVVVLTTEAGVEC